MLPITIHQFLLQVFSLFVIEALFFKKSSQGFTFLRVHRKKYSTPYTTHTIKIKLTVIIMASSLVILGPDSVYVPVSFESFWIDLESSFYICCGKRVGCALPGCFSEIGLSFF